MSKKDDVTGQALADSFDVLSQESTIESVIETDSTLKANTGDKAADNLLNNLKKQEQKAAEEKSAEENLELDEEKKDDKKDPKQPEAGAEKKVEKKDEKKDDKKVEQKKDEKKDASDDNGEEELTLEDAPKGTPKASKEGEVETTWTEVAKEMGIELKEESYDSFKKALTEKVEANISKYKPETQRLMKFAEAGGDYKDFIEPFSKIDKVLSMSDADLAAHHFKIKKVDDAKAQARIERMAEDGELESFVEEIRDNLRGYRKDVENQIIDQKIKAQEAYELKQKNAFKDEAVHIKTALEKRKDFLGTPLKEENRAKIFEKYSKGDYEETFKDPEVLADFLLFKEYGERAKTNLKQILKRELRNEYKNDRHNIPPKTGNAGAVRQSSGHASDNVFDILEEERR
jgi:hypothetical protein